MKFLIVILALIPGTSAYAGSADAEIKCVSGSGRTKLIFYVPDMVGDVSAAKFEIDGQAIEWKNDDIHSDSFDSTAVISKKDKVFTATIEKKDGEHHWFKFWAIPSTFKVVKDGNNSASWKFSGKVHGSDPRSENTFTPEILLNCTLEYSI